MSRCFPILALGAAMTLAACQSEDVTRMCAASGDPATGLTAHATNAAGGVVRLLSDGEGTRILVADLETPIVADLWQDAELTFQATRRGEVSPCEGPSASYVVAEFEAADTEVRATRCAGNAVARLAGRIAETSAAAMAGATQTETTLPQRPESAGQACAWAHDQL